MPLPTLAVTPGSGATINTLPPGGQAAGASSLPVVIASDQSPVPVSLAGGATAALQGAGNTTLASILTALLTQHAETLWTDDSGAYFVRIDLAGTITWTDVSGNATSAPGTGSRPAAGATVLLDKSSYQATASGTGYSTGDLIDHVLTTDPTSGAVIGHFWLNLTTEAKLTSAPTSANITPLSPLPSGAATSALQTALNTAIAATQPRSIVSNAPRVSTSGTLTNINDAVTLALDGMNTVVVQAAAGSWTGTALFEASADAGVTFTAVSLVPYAGGAAAAGPTPGSLWEMACGGLTHLRVRASTAITSGPASIIVAAANGMKSVRVGNPSANPLTTQPGYATSGKTAVTGTFASTGQSASFTPLAGRGFNISLYGTFVATVQVERSFDGGTNWLPITAAGTQLLKWTAPASEQWSEDETPVLYRLNCTAWTSGAVNYRVSQ